MPVQCRRLLHRDFGGLLPAGTKRTGGRFDEPGDTELRAEVLGRGSSGEREGWSDVGGLVVVGVEDRFLLLEDVLGGLRLLVVILLEVLI